MSDVERSIVEALADSDPGYWNDIVGVYECSLCGDWMSNHTDETCPWLRALDVVLNCTCDDTVTPDLIDVIEDLLGPLSGDQVLVLRNVNLTSSFLDEESSGEKFLRLLIESAEARGLTGDMARHLPMVVCLDASDASLELLNEDDMRAAGWRRT